MDNNGEAYMKSDDTPCMDNNKEVYTKSSGASSMDSKERIYMESSNVDSEQGCLHGEQQAKSIRIIIRKSTRKTARKAT